MSRPRSALTRGLLTFLAVLLATFAVAVLTSGGTEASAPPDSTPVTAAAAAAPPASSVDTVGAAGAGIANNDFMPERENASDCVSLAVQRPNCGSKAKGGWRQGLVFGVIAAGMALIAWRLVVSVRKRDHAVNAS